MQKQVVKFKNIMNHKYKGSYLWLTLKCRHSAGIKSYSSVDEIPENIDLAILAIASHLCPDL